jgi:hypothetical protein
VTAPSATELAADWSQFNPHDYLNEYYRDLGAENLALLRFQAQAYQDLPWGGVLLDFGGGPTIYQLISSVTRVEEIHFSDYLECNLREVQRWLSEDPHAFDWRPFIRKSLEFEGRPRAEADIDEREHLIRTKVTRLIRCDAGRLPPIDLSHGPYDLVTTNFCAESATSDRAEWQAYTANIASLLKPGGWLVMCALKGATRYAVGPRVFPAVDISEDDLVELLDENGFPRKRIDLRSVAADRVSRDYQGLIMSIAQKDPGRSNGSP